MSKSKHTITASQAQGLRMGLPDAYDVDELDFGQIIQQIEQTAPYTDFIVFKGYMDMEFIEKLEARGFYVNNLLNTDKEAKEGEKVYTLVSWLKV